MSFAVCQASTPSTMESDRVIVIRALRAARGVAAEHLDVRKHPCYDRAFLQLATNLIAEAEIIIAHCQTEDKDLKELVRRFQKKVEEIRSDYPLNTGATIVWMSSDEDSIPENPPLEVARLLNLYTKTLQDLRYYLLSNLTSFFTLIDYKLISSDAKKGFHDVLFLIGANMIREEIAQCEEEGLYLLRKLGDLIEEDGRSLRTGETPSVCFQDQKKATINRAKQLLARMAKTEAAQRQPESLIQLFFY